MPINKQEWERHRDDMYSNLQALADKKQERTREELNGVVTLDVRYEFDLSDEHFTDCTYVEEALYFIFDPENDVDDLCNRKEVHALYYEGFEIFDEIRKRLEMRKNGITNELTIEFSEWLKTIRIEKDT